MICNYLFMLIALSEISWLEKQRDMSRAPSKNSLLSSTFFNEPGEWDYPLWLEERNNCEMKRYLSHTALLREKEFAPFRQAFLGTPQECPDEYKNFIAVYSEIFKGYYQWFEIRIPMRLKIVDKTFLSFLENRLKSL